MEKEIEEHDIRINSLHLKGPSSSFRIPARTDKVWVPQRHIISIVEPTTVNSTQYAAAQMLIESKLRKGILSPMMTSTVSPATSPPQPRILQGSAIDAKDDFEELLQKKYAHLQELIKGLPEREVNDVLLKNAQSSEHDDIQMALLFGILSTRVPNMEQSYYKHMIATNRDGYTQLFSKMRDITGTHRLSKLSDLAHQRLLWLVRQLVTSSVPTVESVVHDLLRQVAGGDLSPRNTYLTENILDIINDNMSWLDKQQTSSMFHGMALYTFLRVLADHLDPQFSALRNKEAKFCSFLMINKWNECKVIGRDLIRLLQAVARIPEIDQIWRKILNDPKSLSPSFSGLTQLMKTKTPKRMLQLRLTHEMERKLVYLLSQVKFGNHRRYQDWFQRQGTPKIFERRKLLRSLSLNSSSPFGQYLATPESQTLRADLVRFICDVYFPNNNQLQSDLMPRWAVLGWLLATCNTNVSAANSKLALFWDWLFFDRNTDSIMMIEPGILVIQHSMKPHLQLSVSLLDFICRIIPNFMPSMKDQVLDGVNSAFNFLLEKRVVAGLSPLFESAKIDRELRNHLRETFPQFCNNTTPEVLTARKKDIMPSSDLPPIDLLMPQTPPSQPLPSPGLPEVFQHMQPQKSKPEVKPEATTTKLELTKSPPSEIDSAFSDPDEPVPPKKSKKEATTSAFTPIQPPSRRLYRSSTSRDKRALSLDEYLNKLPSEFSQLLTQLREEHDDEKKCELVEKILQAYDELDDDDGPTISANTAGALVRLLEKEFDNINLPSEITDESLEDSIVSPLFALYRNISSLPSDDQGRDDMCYMLQEMRKLEPKIGYSLLYFLKVGKTPDDKMHTYKTTMSMGCDDKEEERKFILEDMTLCLDVDMRMFMFILPDVYHNFLTLTSSNPDLMLLVCSNIDGTQLLELVSQIHLGHVMMFKKDTIVQILTKSLEWETIEQYFLWQLICAHDVTAEQVMPILAKCDYQLHAEALTGLMCLLKSKCVSTDLVRMVLCRHPLPDDLFSTAMLKLWSTEDEDKTSESISHFLTLSIGTPRKPNKKSKKEMPSVDYVLGHLDNMRMKCKNISFLTNDTIQQALQQVQHSSNDAQQQRFPELFALVMDEDEAPTASASRRNLRQTAARRANNASPKPLGGDRRRRHSDTSDSDDDELKIQPLKKRKKNVNVIIEIDDSDE